jgi:hypothetical protein
MPPAKMAGQTRPFEVGEHVSVTIPSHGRIQGMIIESIACPLASCGCHHLVILEKDGTRHSRVSTAEHRDLERLTVGAFLQEGGIGDVEQAF